MITSFSNEKPIAGQLQTPRFFQVSTYADGQVISANDLFLQKLGIDTHQVTGHYFNETVSPLFLGKFTEILDTCTRQKTVAVELSHKNTPGDQLTIYWEINSHCIGSDQRRYLQWTGIEVNNMEENSNVARQVERSELFFKALIADSLDGMLLVDSQGLVSFASASVMHVLGWEPADLVGKNCFEFVHPEDRELGMGAFIDEVRQEAERKFIGIRLLQKTGEWRWCMVRGHNLLFNPAVGKMLIYFSDDSYRRGIEAELIESRERFLHLVQNLSIGVILCDPNGSILLCNQACLDIFHLLEDDLKGSNVFQSEYLITNEKGVRLPVEDYPVVKAIKSNRIIKNSTVGIRKPGEEKTTWLQVNVQPVLEQDGRLKHVICSFTDITEQKTLALQLAQQEQQKQKQLMQATIDGQERERSEISRELHDNISQHLTTTRLYMEVALDKTNEQPREMISQAHKGLLYIGHELRRLSQSLAPPELRDIGMVESIRDLCNHIKNLHPYAIEFEHDQFDEDRLADNMKVMIFRIIQEQVNNIIRHANASRVAISLVSNETEARITVADNGQGFDTALVKKGLGLTNIYNRVSLFDGTVDISTSPGNGCYLQMRVPLK